MIKTLVIDENHRFRKALKGFLDVAPGIIIVGDFDNVREIFSKTTLLMPDVVLVGMRMGVLDTIRQIRERFPSISVIILGLDDIDAYRDAAIAAGACAYVTKWTLADELLSTIQEVVRTS